MYSNAQFQGQHIIVCGRSQLQYGSLQCRTVQAEHRGAQRPRRAVPVHTMTSQHRSYWALAPDGSEWGNFKPPSVYHRYPLSTILNELPSPYGRSVKQKSLSYLYRGSKPWPSSPWCSRYTDYAHLAHHSGKKAEAIFRSTLSDVGHSVLSLGGSHSSPLCPYCQEQRVDRALLEKHWQGKTEVLAENAVNFI